MATAALTKVRWGVLGCSDFAARRAIPAMRQAPSVKLQGIAGRNLEKARSFRSRFGFEQVFDTYDHLLRSEKIDAVYIPLPNALHGRWMMEAARYGKQILCEKPFTHTAAEARRVAESITRAGVRAWEGFMWRLHPQHREALDIIETNTIGAVRLIRSSFTHPLVSKPNIRFDRDLGGGCLLDLGCYAVAAARFYFRSEPIRVFAGGTFDPHTGVDIRVAGVLEFDLGLALIDCGFQLPGRTDLEIVTDKGTIHFPKPWAPDEVARIFVSGKEKRFPPTNQYIEQFEHFSQCVLKNVPLGFGVEDAVLQMTAIDALLRSLRSGHSEVLRP